MKKIEVDGKQREFEREQQLTERGSMKKNSTKNIEGDQGGREVYTGQMASSPQHNGIDL